MKLRSSSSYLVLFCILTTLFLVISCGKENSRNGSADEQEMLASKTSSESDGEAEIVFNGLFDDALGVNTEVGMGGAGIFGRTETCPTITVVHLNGTNAGFPIRVTIDFGVTGCTGPRIGDPRLRRGKIIINYSDRLINPGAVVTTEFDNFYLDSTKIEGRHIITNISTVSQGNKSYKAEVIDGKLIRPSGNYSQWNSTKYIVQIEGSSTPLLALDDQFKITGNARGKVLRGNLLVQWESNITEPLLKKISCNWIVKGIVRTVRVNTPSTSPWVAELDYGPGILGNCDNHATITINGVLHQITLP